MPGSSLRSHVPLGMFRVPDPPEPHAPLPQTCVLPPSGSAALAHPRPPLSGTFLGTSGGAGPARRVETPQEGE